MHLKSIVLGVTIFILTLFVTTYGVNMIYPSPEYEDYCPISAKLIINTEADCVEAGGNWQVYPAREGGDVEGYCDQFVRCSQNFEDAEKKNAKQVFLLAVPLGILIVLLGAYLFALDVVGVGLMAGGVGTILRGISGFWRYSSDWLKFIISLVGLAIVIYFSYKFADKLGFGVKKKK